jgi:hypothetical protein
VRLILEAVEDVRVVRDQVRVDRGDVTRGDQAQRRVAEAETPSYWPVRISVTISSEVIADLRVHLAARVGLEVRDPVHLRSVLPSST